MSQQAKILVALGIMSIGLAGCSPATTFEGISTSFERLEANLASSPPSQEHELTDHDGSVDLPPLSYAEDAPDALADRREINGLIRHYAQVYDVPEALVHRLVNRESAYNSKARNGIHLGLMQLNPQTARTMGYRGPDLGLFDSNTNLKFGVKYLRGALMVAKGNHDRADKLYQTGYYYHAKHMGLLQATGLRP